ncbi:hypothetical protein ASD11_02320 [Aeromicrobium sp. Root495]|uniref:hypothetical protein n=1 Tax=Aeromicrobium sp. Root495 TaxID=1736550 RepID=UPI0006FB510E|nr:hypothetical protein [Aeromicrobium sp. Root495]KQY58519.1 hypothetical protein ASD11_02320 [Aeromicrobium sp. Root495]
MRRHVVHLIAATLVAGTVAAVPVAAGAAAVAPTSEQLGTALGLPAGITAAFAGDPAAAVIATKAFNDFPRRSPAGAASAQTYGQDGQYLVMSTGRAAQIFDESALGASRQPSTDLGAEDDGDTAALTLTATSAAASRCLLVDLAMSTEERVHTYTTASPSDTISLKRDGDETQYARQPGAQYFSQATSPAEPVDYSVNAIDYWHAPGDEGDRAVGDQANPWAESSVTPFDHVTRVETLEVPLPAGQDNVVRLAINDANNDLLDSAALVDRVRVASRCSTSSNAYTGLSTQNFVVRGDRGIGNTLTVDPVPATDAIERYDELDNGWFAGSARGVDLRFRWYRTQYLCTAGAALSTDMDKWSPIPDADRQSYVPTAADKGLCLVALVTGVKDGWRHETFPSPTADTWNATLPIGNGVFAEPSLPVISQQTASPDGKIRVGDKLSAAAADFKPRQDTMSYQWFQVAPDSTLLTKIVGATASDFTVTSAQAGKKLVVVVTAERLNFNDRAISSAQTSPVLTQDMTSTPVPTIAGSVVAGQTVTASPGTWEPAPVTFSYQWYLDGQILTTAKSANLTLRPEYAGRTVAVAVTGSKSGYTPVTRTSQTSTVAGASMGGATPTITGTAKVGQTLTGGTAASWSPLGSSLTFIWRTSAGVTLMSGTSRTLVVPASALGKTISLTIQGEKSGYVTAIRTSAATATVKAGTITASAVRVSGTAKVGRTLTAYAGTWRPTPVKLSYRWYANNKPITGAVRSKFKIPSWAKGRRLKVKVTGTKTGFTSTYRVSAQTSRVAR